MPYTERQRRYMYADAARAEKGQQTRTGMTLGQLLDYARKPLEKKRKAPLKPGAA